MFWLLRPSTYFPEESWAFTLALCCSSKRATSVMPDIVSAWATAGLNEVTICKVVSLSRAVAMFTLASFSIRNLAEYSSPKYNKSDYSSPN